MLHVFHRLGSFYDEFCSLRYRALNELEKIIKKVDLIEKIAVLQH